MKEIKLKLIKDKEVHSEYSYTYSNDEERKEYFLKIEEYAKKIEHEIELISDLEIEPIKNEEEIMLERAEKIKALKRLKTTDYDTVKELSSVVKKLIELL